MAKLYKKFYISGVDAETMLFSEEEIKEYVKLFPKKTEVLIQEFDIPCCDCCKGHTWRELMGYDKWSHAID